ncbi:hypothetical protein Agub_g1755, partial [Astrephomene gubernaculifera]
PCFEPLSRLMAVASAGFLEKLWANATVIAAAPNPYSHAARAYLHVGGSWKSSKERCRPLPFSHFAADPASLPIQGGMFRCNVATDKEEEGKQGVTREMREAGMPVPGGAVHDLSRVEPVAACLTSGEGGWAADYVVRAEVPYVLEDLEAAVALATERRRSGGGMESSALQGQLLVPNKDFVQRHFGDEPDTEQLAALYETCGAVCRQQVEEFYRADLQLLGLAV